MEKTIFPAGSSEAVKYAAGLLTNSCLCPVKELTQSVDYILLDVPSFNSEGLLRSGSRIDKLLETVSSSTTIIGGNLHHPALEGFRTLDLLRDARYLAENAYITAECALDVALPYLTVTLRQCPVLILGWGRIGKCLGKLLTALDADVTVAARKEEDRAILSALGYGVRDIFSIEDMERYRLIFNTVPQLILNRAQMARCRQDCVKIDLASSPGMEDEDVIIARGLPGIHFPESSGRLIAETILRKESLL